MNVDDSVGQHLSERTRALVRSLKAEAQLIRWLLGPWGAVAPRQVKWAVLERWCIPGAAWIETGTYRGDTTAHLSKISPRVVSIEADAGLAARARKRFVGSGRISIVEGESQCLLGDILASWSGPANVWLDAHFSGDGTYSGDVECPIRGELDSLSSFLLSGERLAVFIDDTRLFGGSYSASDGYPPLLSLAEWASSQNLRWTVEHDIFVAISD